MVQVVELTQTAPEIVLAVTETISVADTADEIPVATSVDLPEMSVVQLPEVATIEVSDVRTTETQDVPAEVDAPISLEVSAPIVIESPTITVEPVLAEAVQDAVLEMDAPKEAEASLFVESTNEPDSQILVSHAEDSIIQQSEKIVVKQNETVSLKTGHTEKSAFVEEPVNLDKPVVSTTVNTASTTLKVSPAPVAPTQMHEEETHIEPPAITVEAPYQLVQTQSELTGTYR